LTVGFRFLHKHVFLHRFMKKAARMIMLAAAEQRGKQCRISSAYGFPCG
jgi:hypothetical protein